MIIPVSAAPDVQAAFRAIQGLLSTVAGPGNADFHGRRIINAEEAIDAFDYVTLGQLQREVRRSSRSVIQTASGLTPAIRFGLHDDRPAPLGEAALYWETDRAALYQVQAGVWVLLLCRPLRTSATKPADLGTDDVGFTWFQSDEGVTYRWSGSAWNYYLGSLVAVYANRPSDALADRGFLFIASDRNDLTWRKGASTWELMEGIGGPHRGVLGSIPTPAATDVGYMYYASDYDRTYRWTGAAWTDAEVGVPRKTVCFFDTASTPTGWALCDGGGATISTAAGGTAGYTTPNLLTTGIGNCFVRSANLPGGNGGVAVHHHSVNPPSTTSGAPSAVVKVTLEPVTGTDVGSGSHTHDTDINSFASGDTTVLPPYYDLVPFVRL